MKKVSWAIIVGAIIVITEAFVFVMTRIIMNPPKSWGWFLGLMGLYAFLGLIAGLIMLIRKGTKEKPIDLKADPKIIKDKIILEILEDEDNPDNFIVKDKTIYNVGEEGSPKTPVMWLTGIGSEKNQKIDVIVNLNSPDPVKSATIRRNATDETIVECIRRMAENPEREIKEEKILGVDEFGRTQTRIITRRVNEAQKKEEKQKEEAEEANAY